MLNKNAFFLLEVSPRDNKEAIAEAFDEKLADGQIEESSLHHAQKTLMASKSRLEAELGWFPDVAPKRTKQIAEKVKADSDIEFYKNLLSELNGVSKANLAAYVCQNKKGDIDFLEALISAQSEISDESIKASINANRKVAGFPDVDNSLVNQQLEKQRQQWAEAAIQQISQSDHPGNYITALLEKFADSDLSSKRFLDNLMERYESFIVPRLRNYEDKINNLISKIQEDNADNVTGLVSEIIGELKLWDEYAQPSQLVYSAKGLDEPRSIKIFTLVRDLALWLANEKDEHKLSLELTKAAKDIFAELPSVSNMIDDDIGTLEGLIAEADSFELATPLITVILPIFKDEKDFAKALKKKDFSADAPGVAGELYRAFLKVKTDAEATEHNHLPWGLMRKLVIHINNERDNPELAKKILVAIAAMNPPLDLKDQIAQDLHGNKEAILGKEFKKAIDNKNTSRAKTILNELIDLAQTEEEKNQWRAILKTLNDKVREKYIGWAVWIVILVGLSMLGECNDSSKKTSSYTPAQTSTYSSNNTGSQGQIVEYSDLPPRTEAAPPAFNSSPSPNTNQFSDLVPTNKANVTASFNCSEAKSSLEILICADSDLASLDGQVGETYTQLRDITSSNNQINTMLLDEQRQFLKSRLETCKIPYQTTLTETQSRSIINCLKTQYSQRLVTLQGYAATIQKNKAEAASKDLEPEVKKSVWAGVNKFFEIWNVTGMQGARAYIQDE